MAEGGLRAPGGAGAAARGAWRGPPSQRLVAYRSAHGAALRPCCHPRLTRGLGRRRLPLAALPTCRWASKVLGGPVGLEAKGAGLQRTAERLHCRANSCARSTCRRCRTCRLGCEQGLVACARPAQPQQCASGTHAGACARLSRVDRRRRRLPLVGGSGSLGRPGARPRITLPVAPPGSVRVPCVPACGMGLARHLRPLPLPRSRA